MYIFGYLSLALMYFLLMEGVLAVMVWHVGKKVAVPWASPWRMLSPKLLLIAGPGLCAPAYAIGMTRPPGWAVAALFVVVLLVPSAGTVLIVVEWLRRRAEDRATGLTRPVRPRI